MVRSTRNFRGSGEGVRGTKAPIFLCFPVSAGASHCPNQTSTEGAEALLMCLILFSLLGQGTQCKGAENRAGRTNGLCSEQYLNQNLGTWKKDGGNNKSWGDNEPMFPTDQKYLTH